MPNPSTLTPLSSEQEISNLIAAYAFRNDDGDIAGLGDLFAEAVFTLDGVVARGKADVEALARKIIKLRADGLSATSHEITNISILIDESAGTATTQSYWTLYQSISGVPRQAVLAGRYCDVFNRQDGVWRFTARDAVTRWNALAGEPRRDLERERDAGHGGAERP